MTLELFGGDTLAQTANAVTGIVDDHIDMAFQLQCLSKCIVYGRIAGNIEFQQVQCTGFTLSVSAQFRGCCRVFTFEATHGCNDLVSSVNQCSRNQ